MRTFYNPALMLAWFNTKEVDAFADSVVAELRARFPRAASKCRPRRTCSAC
jgi:hypothetical protein